MNSLNPLTKLIRKAVSLSLIFSILGSIGFAAPVLAGVLYQTECSFAPHGNIHGGCFTHDAGSTVIDRPRPYSRLLP